MKDEQTIELDISKEEFIERLRAVTVPMDLGLINQTNKVKNVLKQDSDAMNKEYNLSQDIFYYYNSSDLEDKIFAGEVSDRQIRIFLPNPHNEKSWQGDFVQEMLDEESKRDLEKYFLDTNNFASFVKSHSSFYAADRQRLLASKIEFNQSAKALGLLVKTIYLKPDSVFLFYYNRLNFSCSIISFAFILVFFLTMFFEQISLKYLSSEIVDLARIYSLPLFSISYLIDLYLYYRTIRKHADQIGDFFHKSVINILRAIAKTN